MALLCTVCSDREKSKSCYFSPSYRCDLVFLPPSFPIVAMENPCLTFIIASILESSEFLLVDVVHEIAHGWFGNAVTNATWEEMWLSEGLATYAQRRITTEAYGKSLDTEAYGEWLLKVKIL